MADLPYKGQPILTCPITQLRIHLKDAVWRHGAWVHPDADDERGFREKPEPAPVPHPLMLKKRHRPPLGWRG